MRQQGKSVAIYYNAVLTIDQKLIVQPNSRKLQQHICIEAERNMSFKENVITWINHGGTVFLRDDICDQFKKEFKGENEWFDAFCEIDSIRLKVA